ncbi:hypothetical protein LCGC14_0848610 [marine sediment metagenome]|uniref:Uncharacterized protein n=1 Tax=marine sediment metagenome TaxID=412755 RepID=A0A0F9PAY7_9ZZZZ
MASGYPDFEGSKSGLYLQSNWRELGGSRKILSGVKTGATFKQSAEILHVVPTGLTLYITTLSASCIASAAADGDNNQMCLMEIFAPTILDKQIAAALNGGGIFPLGQEIKVAAGETFTGYLYSYANHKVDLVLVVRGYEI